MGVESGPSGAIGAGVAGSVVARGFSNIVNEGPVRGSLQGFRFMNASDIYTIDKGGTGAPKRPLVVEQAKAVATKAWEASELNVADAISEAQSIIAQAPLAFARDSSLASLRSGLIAQNDREIESIVVPQVKSRVVPLVASRLAQVLDVSPSLQTEKSVSYQTAPTISPQPLLQEQEVEEIVTEKVTKEEPGMVEEEEIEKTRRRYVVDERALSQVVVEFKAAVRRARELAGKLGIKITGKLISKFLPGQHPGNESEAVKGKCLDGSILERQESIRKLREFSSDIQAEDKVVRVAYEKPPIKIRSEGEPVKDEDVARVFKPYVVKPAAATYEIVTRRIKKKVQLVPSGQVAQPQTEARVETSLEDYPELAEVFRKAA